jgi:hypothetical protein
MFRHRPPVLAELPAGAGESVRTGSLSRAELDACEAVLSAVGDSRTVLVTGTAKSKLAIGLATVAAARNRRTALVECDLAAPALAPRLGLAPVPGLHEYLRHEAEAGEILQALVLAGPASAGATAPLTCVAAGTPAASASDLLASAEFGHAITKLRGAYDFVVLDAPPLSDGPSLLAVAVWIDKALACGAKSEIPRRPKVRLDGLVVQV